MGPNAKQNLMGDFIEGIQNLGCLEDLNQLFDATVAKFHFNRYAYQLVKNEVYQSNKPLIVATYPTEWVNYYIEQSYQKIDPLVLYGNNEKLPFTWDTLWQGREISKQQSDFLHQAAEYSLATGVSFPIRGINNSYAMVTMAAADDGVRGVQKLFDEYRDVLHILSLYYHSTACELIARSHNNDNKPFSPLTPRETEILEMAYQEKSYSTIATIKGISRHCVDSHFRSIREKLGVYSVQGAVIRGLRLKLFLP